jgi:hypothetical protein
MRKLRRCIVWGSCTREVNLSGRHCSSMFAFCNSFKFCFETHSQIFVASPSAESSEVALSTLVQRFPVALLDTSTYKNSKAHLCVSYAFTHLAFDPKYYMIPTLEK